MSDEEIRVIDVTGNPKAREEVLNAKIFPEEKDENGLPVLRDFPFLYRDREKKLTLWYSPTEEAAEAVRRFTPEEIGGYEENGGEFRIVGSFNRLIEKILIRDAGLEDRIVEIIKILALSESSKKNPDITKTIPLFSETGRNEYQLSFYWQGTIQGTVPFNLDLYRSVEKDFRPMADNTPVTAYTVDSGWVDRMIDQANR